MRPMEEVVTFVESYFQEEAWEVNKMKKKHDVKLLKKFGIWLNNYSSSLICILFHNWADIKLQFDKEVYLVYLENHSKNFGVFKLSTMKEYGLFAWGPSYSLSFTSMMLMGSWWRRNSLFSSSMSIYPAMKPLFFSFRSISVELVSAKISWKWSIIFRTLLKCFIIFWWWDRHCSLFRAFPKH